MKNQKIKSKANQKFKHRKREQHKNNKKLQKKKDTPEKQVIDLKALNLRLETNLHKQ